MTDLKRHRAYYFFLISILMLGIFLFTISAPNRALEALSIVTVAISYFFVGIVHHIQNHDLSSKIVIEYALIASLGLACIFFILKVGFGL